jgi:hypothetical protein
MDSKSEEGEESEERCNVCGTEQDEESEGGWNSREQRAIGMTRRGWT